MCESDSDRMSSVMTGHQFSEIHVWHLGRKWEPGMEPRTEKEGIKHSANSGNKVLKKCAGGKTWEQSITEPGQ